MDTPAPQLLRIEDVVARTQLSKGTIRKLERLGKFPPLLKLGANARWRTSDIEAWMAALERRHPTA